ncbi:hemerythrin domain-containing protein [Nocardioides sp. TF02-7]|uniref:hemerythrin domain-containing protein n=1 Tax=Nocardioides sp. TF02-7 TaxID=2917724 RepID=UPI001F05F805|nr:hemerythrin domain-containing protein [Nocardioides sp. TF02-7]UMG92536.1 hemerythrin domain-containing protein [Nocardioides sp. TF02-7]
MRSLADQSEDELGGPWSVLVRQKRDHVVLDRLLEEVLATSGTAQDAALHRVARLVFPHAFAEESVLWPELRRTLPDGEALTLQVEQEHQEVNELWTRLESADLTGEEREQVVGRLVEVLREDVRDEEDQLLPRLQQAVDVRRLRALGVAWEAVRRTAPTRPHPVVSRRPPGNALAALPLTVLDRARDGLDAAARSDRVPSGAADRFRTASALLARGAGRVETFGPLRRGEDPSTGTEP